MYKLIQDNNETISIKRLEDSAYIPLDEGNADYRQYIYWVAEGNAAEVEELPVFKGEITAVSPFQAKAALLQMGLLDKVEELIKSEDRMFQLAWETATEFRRDSSTLKMLGSKLNLTDDQVDDLFELAASIQA